MVDEFQEFFTEDDAMAHGASLLLDRLVRQGRAFGVHVVLGSQTLGGAYNLGRSAMGQMAVRIALQCSEADAALVLSEENLAARLLSRPGEAIYNDASGAVAGNSPFQVAWLSPESHEAALMAIRRRSEADRRDRSPCVVFEGAAFVDITKSAPFGDAGPARAVEVGAPGAPAHAKELDLWLGESLSIKPPTSVPLRRRAGGNLIVIGANREAATALICAAIASVGVAGAAGGGDEVRAVVLDGDEAAGPLSHLARRSRRVVHVAGPDAVAEEVSKAHAEFESRRECDARAAPALVLFAHGLHRLRPLRMKADEFGFAREAGADDPAGRFRELLREGPEHGVHTIAWVDSLGSLQRALGRQALQEFGLRALLHMSAADSTSIVDSPDASRLGPWRAILYDEENARVEKFRPYATPPIDWLLRAIGGAE